MTDTTREDELLRIILEQDDRHKLDVAELATLRDQAASREEDVRSLNEIVARLDTENATLRKVIDDRRTVEGWVNDSDEERYCQLIRDAQAGTFTVALTDLGQLDLVDCPDGEEADMSPCTNASDSAFIPGETSFEDTRKSWGLRFWYFKYPVCQTLEEYIQKMHVLMVETTTNGCSQ